MNRGQNGGRKMPTDAEKRANTTWKKLNTIQVNIRLYKNTDQDLIAFIQSLDNVQGTIKEILRKHMGEYK